jgi:hypothetical protein
MVGLSISALPLHWLRINLRTNDLLYLPFLIQVKDFRVLENLPLLITRSRPVKPTLRALPWLRQHPTF